MSIKHHEILTESKSHRVTESHRGLVVGTYVNHSVRIMSDVWADISYAVVYEPNGPEGHRADEVIENAEKGYGSKPGLFRNIQIGNSEFYSSKDYIKAEIDAGEDTLEIYEAYKAGKAFAEKLRDSASQDFRAAERRRTVNEGCTVRVTKGRKVPKGTEGIVFWMGDKGYGTSVGIGIPSEDGTYEKVTREGRYGKAYESYANVAWTSISNVERINKLGGRIL